MPTAMPRKAARRRVLELVERFGLLRHMGLVLSVVVPLVGFNRVGCISLVRCRFFSAGFRRIESTGRRTPRSATEKLDFRGMRLPFGVVRVKPSISTGRAHTQRYTSSDGTRVPSDRFRPHCSGLSEPRGIAFSRRWPGLTCPVHGVEGRDWIVASPPWKRGSSQWPESNPGPRKGSLRVDDCRRRDPMTVVLISDASAEPARAEARAPHPSRAPASMAFR